MKDKSKTLRNILEEMYDDVEDIDFDIKEKIDQTISKIAKLEAKNRCSTTIKRYSIVCPSCQGTGRIPEVGYTANTSRECPACKGIGVVEVKEER